MRLRASWTRRFPSQYRAKKRRDVRGACLPIAETRNGVERSFVQAARRIQPLDAGILATRYQNLRHGIESIALGELIALVVPRLFRC
jgi:hypothetical protein